MIEIADWVMNAFHPNDIGDTKDHRSLRNKVLVHAEEMGMKGCYKKDGNSWLQG